MQESNVTLFLHQHYERKKQIKRQAHERLLLNRLDPTNVFGNVPGLYQQDGVELKNVKVYGIYFVPFRSNWTWYLTEYDPSTNEAFGLVCGHECEFGYFNLKELARNGAQRLLALREPKTFLQLRDCELRKQMTNEEMTRVFDNNFLNE